MEGQQPIVLKNLPIATRNYTVVDTATGRPVDNTTYSLTIAPHVIEKLYELKRINEEKKQQALLRQQYAQDSLTAAYTPTDNSVFSSMSNNEYIDVRDMSSNSYASYQEQQPEGYVEEYNQPPRVEAMQSDGLLSRVTARAPEQEYREIKLDEPKAPELDYITADTYQQTNNYEYEMPPVATDNSTFNPTDNSTFNPENAGAYNQGTAININNYGGNMEETQVQVTEKKEKRSKKEKAEPRRRADYVDLTPEEIKAGRGIAWLAYILFFIPLLIKRNNRFVRIHVNEGLDINIAEVIGTLLILPFFLLKNVTGTAEIAVYVAGILGVVILAACALTIIPVMIGSLCGAQFQIPWLFRRRLIRVNKD